MQQNDYNLFWGLKLADNRFNNYHIIDKNHEWDSDVTKFPGPQNSMAFERAFIPIGNYLQELTLTKWHYSFYISAVYLVVIFGIQHLMRNQKPFRLQGALILWNLVLAVFSAVGVYRCLPEFYHILTTEGIEASFTKSTYYNDFRPTVWYLFFTLSKSIELIDTLFIVLRKSKLIPLHWVHHVLTLCFSWFVFSDVPGTARWMVNMNFAVHTLMYFYYALKAMKIHISRRVSLTITTLQVLQMFAGLYINFQSVSLKLKGMPVDISYPVALTGLLLYGIFAILFIKFFVSTYVISKLPMQTVFSDINHNHYKGFVKKLQ